MYVGCKLGLCYLLSGQLQIGLTSCNFNMEHAKILIGNRQLSEEELDKNFQHLFITCCDAGIPISGFLADNTGQYIFGEIKTFTEVFGTKFKIIPFDYYKYIEKPDPIFWLCELAENPLDSKLIKMTKASS